MHKLRITHQGHESDFFLHNEVDQFMMVSILAGKTYPTVKHVQPKVIMDIGANVGSTSVFFGITYPNALVYAFEPTTMNYELLEKNTHTFPNIKTFKVGILNENTLTSIYLNSKNPGSNSLYPEGRFFESSEEAKFINLNHFMNENKVSNIDILKIDTEGCEVTILESIVDIIPNISVIYIEYHTKKHGEIVNNLLSVSHKLNHHQLCGSIKAKIDENLQGKISLDEVKIHDQVFLAKNQAIETKHIEVLQQYNVPTLKIVSEELGEMCWISNSLAEKQNTALN